MIAKGNPEGWRFLVLGLLGAALLWALGVRLKVVRIEQGHLIISNYRSEISVPFSEISDVAENRLINIHPVRIYFRHKTKFGNSIVFMPTTMLWTFARHPVVAELKRLSGCV
jgi:hypothetical protein